MITAPQDQDLTRSLELTHEIERLYYLEAKLLDESRYEEWIELFTDDLHYYVPQTEFVDRPDRSLDYIGAHHFDETKQTLLGHIGYFNSGTNTSEQPASTKLRIINNVFVLGTRDDGTIEVESRFALWQHRWTGEPALYTGRRTDVVRREDCRLRIAARVVYLTDPVLSKALTTFF